MTRPEGPSAENAAMHRATLRADVDRLRDRARAVATLLATASGALTAGLVFSTEGQAFPSATKAVGYVGIAVLAASVAFFLSASLYQLKQPETTEKAKPTNNASIDDRIQTLARQAATEINTRTSIGKWLALIGLVGLVLMLPVGILFPDEEEYISVEVARGTEDAFVGCAELEFPFEARASMEAVKGSSALMPVSIPAEKCDAALDGEVVIHVRRENVLIRQADQG